MKTWQKVLVGFGLVAALAVPTGIAVAATGDGGWHGGAEMMDGRDMHGSMDMMGHHAGSGHDGMGHGGMGHGGMGHSGMGHGDMDGPMSGSAPAR